MAILRIRDKRNDLLCVDLKDLLRLLAPESLGATWIVSSINSELGHEWFEATGEGGAFLESLAHRNARLCGRQLTALAERARQVVWGEFVGWTSGKTDRPWVRIRAIDGMFYDVDSDDPAVLGKIRATYEDVELIATADCQNESGKQPGLTARPC